MPAPKLKAARLPGLIGREDETIVGAIDARYSDQRSRGAHVIEKVKSIAGRGEAGEDERAHAAGSKIQGRGRGQSQSAETSRLVPV